MLEQGDGSLFKILGWAAGIIGTLALSIKLLAAKIPPRTKADQDFLSTLNHDLLKQLAHDTKDILERVHDLEIRQSVQESQISEIKRRL